MKKKMVLDQGLSRRRFLQAAGGCALVAGCEVAEIRVTSSSVGGDFSFDVNTPEFEELKTLGGILARNSGSKKLIMIRTSQTEVVTLDRICPHQQCPMTPGVGEWLSANNTLRCNCHGSEFRADGTYVDGTVSDGLKVPDLGAYPTTFDASTGLGEVLV